MRRPLFLLALAVAVGALLGPLLAVEQVVRIGALAGMLLGLALGAPQARLALPALLAAGAGVAACLAGLELAAYRSAPLRVWIAAYVADPEAPPVELIGRAAADTTADAQRPRLLLEVAELVSAGRHLRLRGRVLVELGGASAAPAVLEGDELRVWASLRLPRRVATPGVPDAERRAFEQNLHAFGYCKSARLLEVRRAAGRLARWRQAARARLQSFVLAGPEQGLVRAMLLGDRSALDEQALEAFRTAGTYHVLAISGAQVALLAALLVGGLRGIGAAPLSTALLATVALAAYALFVGADVPVARATLTALIVVWGRSLDLDADWLNLIGAAALALVAQRPSCVTDVGFQLSFAATVGVLALTPALRGSRRLALDLDLLWAASLAAQAAVAPILAARFQRLPLAGLLLNLAAVPLSTAVLLSGAAVVGASCLASGAAELAGAIAWCLAHALLEVSRWASLLPLLDRHVPAPAWWAVAVHLAALVGLARGALRPRDLAAWALAAASFAWSAPPPGDGRAHLEMLDVGQGECLAVTSPEGRIWLVDVGGAVAGRFDQARSVVAPYLWARGLRRIEGIVVTHSHPDHAGGLPYLLEHFEVGELWEGPAPLGDAAYARLLRGAHRHVRSRTTVRGVRALWDGIAVEVLAPAAPRWRPWTVRNDDSLVLALAFGQRRFLLTGDLEQAGESRLQPGAADLLKVPHHGSRTSSSVALLEAVAPRLALVSAGYQNRFGHPHAQVLARYRERGTLVLRTDLDGALRVATDGERLWIESERSGLRLRLP